METPGAYEDDLSFTLPFLLGSLCSFGPTCRALVAYHLERGGLLLHDVVAVDQNGCNY